MAEMTCLGCGSERTTADGLCARCAQAGSEWTGLWDATLWLDADRVAATPDEVRAVLRAVGWPSASFEEQHAESGTWLLELPPLHARLLLLAMGHLCQSAGGARVEVELP